ncbi:hypothetical protein [Salinimicrobium oceani]|uniref:DUF3575 domain-containing protein n=1 Tax=Salinimicrobium oceani TaxID=2722702 RepID=A0ABX1D400_9FLAO|nr:hypothetical protein [Salinimicrobium oceani]NJW54062.1 hypothetical protein [Salinimicrobium oceani]
MKNFKLGLFFFCLINFLSINPVLAQEQVNVTGGIGTPESLNIGLRIQVDQTQYGIAIGTSPGYKNDNFTISGDFYYHFAGRSGQSDLMPWYIKSGLTYMSNEGEWEKRMNLLLVPRLGRDFNLTPQFGVALEAGIMLLLLNKNIAKKERTGAVSGDLDVIGSGFIQPSAGLKFFYRLY